MPRCIYHRVGQQLIGPKIYDIDTDEIITDDQENVVLTGKNFLSAQGTGKLELCNDSDYSQATIKVEQSIDSWSDTSIQFDVVPGTLLS